MKVVAIVGPTATGKTKLGVMIAEHFNGEVISADSMQIYEGMNIASAKPTAEEMCGIPHHLMGFVPQGEVFSVAKYVELAKQKIIEIHEKQKLPVIVGGTGLYIDSLLNNVEFVKTETDESLRKSLLESAEKNGAEYLWNQLNEIDPESAEKIEPNNIKRVARAIEIFKITGITISEQNRRSKMIPSPYEAIKIGLKTQDRAVLYDRINRRVDLMLEMGIVDEARELFINGSLGDTAKKAIGYKEFEPYFKHELPLDACVETLKQETRRYAKRQLTWFMRDKNIKWFNIDQYTNFDSIAEEVYKLISEKEG